MYQILGNLGLMKSAWASRKWLGRLKWGRIEKARTAPAPKYPLVLPGRRSLLPAESPEGFLNAVAESCLDEAAP